MSVLIRIQFVPMKEKIKDVKKPLNFRVSFILKIAIAFFPSIHVI